MSVRRIVVVAAAVLCLGSAAWAQGQEIDHEAMMQEWMEKYAMPGEEHKCFEYYVGNWKSKNTNYMGETAMVSEGMAKFELMMGGRFVRATHTGEFNGMPFEGFGLNGYDRVKGEYFNLWMDNMGTGIMESWGKNEKELSGVWQDPMMGDMPYRMVTKIHGDDKFTFTMYMTMMGDEKKSMEIVYTRVKGS